MLPSVDVFGWSFVGLNLLLMSLEMEIVGTVNGGSYVVKLGVE